MPAKLGSDAYGSLGAISPGGVIPGSYSGIPSLGGGGGIPSPSISAVGGGIPVSIGPESIGGGPFSKFSAPGGGGPSIL